MRKTRLHSDNGTLNW